MNLDSVKIELINWIGNLEDRAVIEEILKVKKEKNTNPKRVFGSGKHLIKHIADDFNEPLEIFKEYEK